MQTLEWRRPLPLRQRMTRAISVPFIAGAAVFGLAVLGTILWVMLRPYDPEATAPQSAATEEGSFLEIGATQLSQSMPGDLQPPTRVVVHIVGEVEQPGIVELEAGARVADAIARAGGTTEEAVLAGVNLARVLIDGEQIVVPNAEQLSSTSAGGFTTATGLININTADEATLESLPGVGPALAARIVSWRQTYGGFKSIDQLLEVSGIGEKTFAPMRELVTV